MKEYSIFVIGNGSAALVSILSIINASKRCGIDLNITCVYDPDIPTIEVGESTSSAILNLLTNILDFRVLKDLSKIDGTIKYGTKYINWSEKEFFTFHVDPALHINSKKFSIWGINELQKKFKSNFTVIHDNIGKVSNTENKKVKLSGKNKEYLCDYIIDCRGFNEENENSEDYNYPVFTSVNSVILYPNENDIFNQSLFTTSIAHDNGWLFQIPLTTRKTTGYLYNNKIISNDEAIAKFSKIIDIPTEQTSKLRNFSWKERYRKLAMEKNILYCGNKLFFTEPSQGFALHYYIILCDIFISSLNINEEIVEDEINTFYLNEINKTEDVLAMTYLSNVKYNTRFWAETREKSIIKLSNSESFLEWCNNINNYTHYSSHSKEILLNLIEGMNIDLSIFRKKI